MYTENTRLSPASRTRLSVTKQDKKKLLSSGFCYSSEPEKENKRMQNDRQVLGPCQRTKKNLENMRVTMIPITVNALEMVPKGVEKQLKELKIRGRIKNLQTTALLRSARILRRVLQT